MILFFMHIHDRKILWYYFTLTSSKKNVFHLIYVQFWPVESESDVNSSRPEKENLYNPGGNEIFRIIESFQIHPMEMDSGVWFYRYK